MNKSTVSKIFSTSLSLALTLTSAPIPAVALGPVEATGPAFVAKLTPPTQFGYVSTSFAPKGETTPRLIIISNLHGHLEVQQNIMGMLEHFVNTLTSAKEGQQTRVPIYLEGAWDKKMEHPLATVNDPKLRAVLSEYMLRKVEMQAVQAYTERFPKATNFTVTGVDNQSQYERNQAVFAKSYAGRRQMLEAIIAEEQHMAAVENFVASSTYEKVRSMRSDYEKGQLSTERYAQWLSRMAGRFGINGESVDILKKVSTMPAGRVDWALMTVHGKLLVKVAEETKPTAAYLRREIRQEKLVKKNLAFAQGYMDVLKRLLSNQLTPEEVGYATSNFNHLVETAHMVLGNESKIDIAGTLRDALSFYSFAFLRDDSLVRNALTELDKDDTHAKTGILVVGGFHTSYIVDYLREKQVPFIQISPVLTRDVLASEQLNYIKRMCDDHVTIQEAAVDFRQPWMNQIIKDTSARLTASTVDINGGKVAGTGENLAGGLGNDEGIKRALGIVKNGVVDAKLAVQGTKAGLQKYFLPGELSGALDQEVNKDIAAAIVNSQIRASIDSRGAIFKAGANGQWTGQGTEQALYGDLISELGNGKLIPEAARNLDRVDEIEIVRSNASIKTYNTKGELVKEDPMVVLTAPSSTDPTKKRAIIVVHVSEQDLQAHNKAHQEVVDLKNQGTLPTNLTPAQSAAVNFFAGIRHEVIHAVTKTGWMLGDLAQGEVNIRMVLSEVMAVAGVEAMDTAIPTPLVALTLQGMTPLLENMGVTAADITKGLGENVTLAGLSDALVKLMQLTDAAEMEKSEAALIDNLVSNYAISEGEARAIVQSLPLLPRITGKLSDQEQEYVVKRVKEQESVNQAG